MKAPTHLAFAGMCGVIASGMGNTPDIPAMSALAVGALIPDIDVSTSGIGRWIKPVSSPLERHFGHRTITHSLLGLFLLGLLSSWLLVFNAGAWAWFLGGAASHILLDTHNIQGVRLLYPMRLEFVSVTNKSWRVGYGTTAEFGYLAFFSVASLALVPLVVDGFAPWFHRALGAPYGAVEDYLLWRNNHEVLLSVRGVNLVLDEDINQQYRVIDALSSEVLIVEDDTGQAFTVGQRSTNIQATRVAAWKGEPMSGSTYRLELAGRRVSDLLASLPMTGTRVLITGELELNQPVSLAPVVGRFARVEASGSTLRLRSARAVDLDPFANLLIEKGSVVVRAYYPPDVDHVAFDGINAPALSSHVLKVANLPSLSGLLLNVGDEVLEGERIARFVDDDALEIAQAEQGAAAARQPELEDALARAQARFEQQEQALERDITAAEDEVAKQRYLVERDASPRNELARAEDALDDARLALLMLQTDWTSERTRLESELRNMRLVIARAERTLNAEIEQQWVTSPIEGVVSEIRVTDATTRGVSLDIIILEGGNLLASN